MNGQHVQVRATANFLSGVHHDGVVRITFGGLTADYRYEVHNHERGKVPFVLRHNERVVVRVDTAVEHLGDDQTSMYEYIRRLCMIAVPAAITEKKAVERGGLVEDPKKADWLRSLCSYALPPYTAPMPRDSAAPAVPHKPAQI